MDPDNCALRPDGTLKDASEIEWYNSPSDEDVPLPDLEEAQPKASFDATPTAPDVVGRNLRHHVPSTKYKEAIAAERRNEETDPCPSPPSPLLPPTTTTATTERAKNGVGRKRKSNKVQNNEIGKKQKVSGKAVASESNKLAARFLLDSIWYRTSSSRREGCANNSNK